MPFLVRPVGGIRPLPVQRESNANDLLKLFEWRQAELESVWQRLAAELRIEGDRLTVARRSTLKLVGVGMLMLHESIADRRTLASIQWLQVW